MQPLPGKDADRHGLDVPNMVEIHSEFIRVAADKMLVMQKPLMPLFGRVCQFNFGRCAQMSMKDHFDPAGRSSVLDVRRSCRNEVGSKRCPHHGCIRILRL